MIVILFGSLILIICLTGTLFYVYTKRIKTRISKQISRQNKVENEQFNDTYDDIYCSQGKQDDTYEAIDEEDRYTAPYYRGMSEYVQMPPGKPVMIQSSDDYWRLPVTDPTYLEMTSSGKSSPNVPRTPNKDKNMQVYTYEL